MPRGTRWTGEGEGMLGDCTPPSCAVRTESKVTIKAWKATSFSLEWGGGGSGYTLCIGDVPPSRVCFSQFLSGKGVAFRPNSLARGVCSS